MVSFESYSDFGGRLVFPALTYLEIPSPPSDFVNTITPSLLTAINCLRILNGVSSFNERNLITVKINGLF